MADFSQRDPKPALGAVRAGGVHSLRALCILVGITPGTYEADELFGWLVRQRGVRLLDSSAGWHFMNAKTHQLWLAQQLRLAEEMLTPRPPPDPEVDAIFAALGGP